LRNESAADANSENCGNLVCDRTETCSSCPTDCGTCDGSNGIDASPSDNRDGGANCGDSVCSESESCNACPSDCELCPTGTTYYLNPASGNDSSPGSQSSPWKTLD